MNMRLVVFTMFACGVAGVALANEAAEMAAKWHNDDFSWIKGMNYTPSYAPNDVVTWRDFDAEVIDRELGYAEKLGLNSVRTWLQYIVYEHNPERFEKDFETFLQLCDKHGLQAMPVLFDSCFGKEPAIDWDGEWVMNPGTSKEMPDYWPKLQKYIDVVVGKHVGDKRIVMWDIMNEPAIFDWTVTFVNHWVEVVRRMDPTHPLTVGVAGAAGAAERYADVEDVLSMHSYAPTEEQLREDIASMKELSKKHGKPVIITECCAPGWGSRYEMVLPVLREAGIGWYAWEVTIGKNQFQAISGLLYPDGTCRRKTEVAAIMGVPVDEVPFEQKPDSEGIPVKVPTGPAPAPQMVKEVADTFRLYATTPTTLENLEERVRLIEEGTGAITAVLAGSPEATEKAIKLWGELIWARSMITDEEAVKLADEMLQLVAERLDAAEAAEKE